MLVWLLIYKMTITINVLLSLHAECSKNYSTIFNSFLICSVASIFLLFIMLLTMSDFITLILFLFFSFVFGILVHYVVCYHVLQSFRDVVVIFE